MWFGGFQAFTLSDYPGCVAAIAFTQGCNFRCPFCHNGALLAPPSKADCLIAETEILDRLRERQGKLEGLVVTGGEPTIHTDLPRFLEQVKGLGYKIKLDTNGSNPDRLAALIEDRLVDYIAMDVKAPLEKYERLCGVPVSTRALEESIAVISWSKVPHHFRTTLVTPLLSPADVRAIRAILPSGSKHVTQRFNPDTALDPALRAAAVSA